ncbi:MAG TPA: hypothetical protein VMW77_04185, partial [Methanoregula sp.]|nr:hypothetical protein [Methanoregula sp.]
WRYHGVLGFVKTLMETSSYSWGLFFILGFCPRCLGTPGIAIIIRRLIKSSENKGVKGMLPVCSLPLWGNEVVTLQSVADKSE